MALNNLCNYMPLKNTGVACSPAPMGDSQKIFLIYLLFSQPMVQAIMNGTKTITRRMLKPQIIDCKERHKAYWGATWQDEPFTVTPEVLQLGKVFCKYCGNGEGMTNPYIPGHIIIVKESHYLFGVWAQNGTTKTGKPKWEFICQDPEVRYYDNPPKKFYKARHKKKPGTPAWYKRSSMFMAFKHCRNFLQIKTVRVERLHAITEADAIREGIQQLKSDIIGTMYKDYLADASGYGHPDHDFPATSYPLNSFRTLWIKINGEKSWLANPFVWVVEFEKIDINFHVPNL